MLREVIRLAYERGGVNSPLAVIDQISTIWFLYRCCGEQMAFVDKSDKYMVEVRRIIYKSKEVNIDIKNLMAQGILAMKGQYVLDIMHSLHNLFEDQKRSQVDAFQVLLKELDYEKNPDLEPTPKDLVDAMSTSITLEMHSFEQTLNILDPCCGTGQLLIGMYNKLKEDRQNRRVNLHGNDASQSMIRICCMNLLLNEIKGFKLTCSDALLELPKSEYQIVLSHLPFSPRLSPVLRSNTEESTDVKFLDQIALRLDYKGVAGVLLPDQVLSAHRFALFRRDLLKSFAVLGGIAVPKNTLQSNKSMEAAVLFFRNTEKPEKTAFFLRWDPNRYASDAYQEIWKKRFTLGVVYREDNFLEQDPFELSLVLTEAMKRKPILSPNYYFEHNSPYKQRPTPTAYKKKVLDQVKRGHDAIKNALSKEDRETKETKYLPEMAAQRLRLLEQEWNLFAQELVIENCIEPYLTERGHVLFRPKLESFQRDDAFLQREQRMQEYLSKHQFELFKTFVDSRQPLPVERALERMNQSAERNRATFGLAEAEQTVELLKKMGVLEPIYKVYFPEDMEINLDPNEMKFQTFILWRVV